MLDTTLVVPEGFITDFASVPRWPLVFLVAGGRADEAAVLHDMLYTTRRYPLLIADAAFREAVVSLGYSPLLAELMFAGVRALGTYTWAAPNVPQGIQLPGLVEEATVKNLLAAERAGRSRVRRQ